jgi:glycosyltransferase involved in cell wall biosynthesis
VEAQKIDVFVDLTGADLDTSAFQRLVTRWARPENLGSVARRLRGVVPPHLRHEGQTPWPADWAFSESASSIPALNAALASAGQVGAPLLLIVGPVDINRDAVGMLRQCLNRDPMYGFAVPRVACEDRCCIAPLARHDVRGEGWLPRSILADLPEAEVLVEINAPCVLISPQVAGNFGLASGRFDDLGAAMLHYMAGARRCGFRATLSNRTVVGIDGLGCRGASRPPSQRTARDEALIHHLVPDFERSWDEFRGGSCERFERLCTSGVDARGGNARASVLFDARNVGAMYNGTSQAILGTLDAFERLQPDWDISILATPEGARFHNLPAAGSGRRVYTELPDRTFSAAVRLSQPWHIQEMVDLHNISLFNAYVILDCIAWDIAYATAPRLEGTWQFLAGHADALMFDSDFSRRRFAERFPASRPVPSSVVHFSFDPGEYALSGARDAKGDDTFILVIGNSLEHKDVRQTVETLASGFPFCRIEALGPASVASPLITARHSGALAQRELHHLYASARYIVFPSFYEGFGFPILTALAYGRTVFARRSELLEEVACRCPPSGRLVVFDRRDELVDLIGRLTHGESVPEYPLGGALTAAPRRWVNVARDIVEFLEPLFRSPVRSRWIAREQAIAQLIAYRA